MNLFKLYFLFFFIFCAFTQRLKAQDTTAQFIDLDFPNERIDKRLANDGLALVNTMWYTAGRPLHWKSRDWKRFGVLMGATLGTMFFLDQPIARAVDKVYSERFNEVASTTFNRFGAPAEHLIFATAIYVPGVAFKSSWMRNTGVLLLSSIGVSGIFQTFLKSAVGRRRPTPDTDFEPFDFRPMIFPGPGDYHSFPSGHAVTGITTTYVLARQTPYLGLKIGFYALGGLIAGSRVYIRAHYASDMIFSTVLSVAVAEANIRYLNSRRRVEAVAGKPQFFARPTGNGIALGYRW
jgi:membrane-associated phospholipid phosphatase